jgi:putative restriction endonuclease
VKVYVGVTDRDWYESLRGRPDLDEVNFWQPSGDRRFGAVGSGDLFLFKLHYPINKIVGGGTFVSFDRFPAWLAWEAFQDKNGAATYNEMRRRIEHYRKTKLSIAGTESIGCIILTTPFFLAESDWIPAPRDWSANIVQGKTYDGAVGVGQELIDAVIGRRTELTLFDAPPTAISGPRFGDLVPVRRRLGQGAFRLLVVDAYGRRCAVSGEKALPVLESAHIRPVANGGEHRVDNGLLLRSDIHTLFDRGYVTITPGGKFRASRRLKDDYDNGEPYYALEKVPVSFPGQEVARPSSDFLTWHNDEVYLG